MRSTLFSGLALSLVIGTSSVAALPSPNGGFSNNNNNGGGGGGGFKTLCTMSAMQSCAQNGHNAPDCFEHLCPMAAAMGRSPAQNQNQNQNQSQSQSQSQGQGNHNAKRVDAFSCTDDNLFQCAIEQWRPAQDCIRQLCP